MIICFSGTGNSAAVARRLSEATGEHIYRIDGWEPKALPALAEGERLGFVFPVYGWDMPRVMRHYLEKITLPATADDTYIYIWCAPVATTSDIPTVFFRRHSHVTVCRPRHFGRY
ncbi:MAG: hypothetical protein ACI4V2_08850 [Alloprevotella sp.]